MPHFEYATCPVCEKTAYGRREIEEKFGYRYDGTTPQSWCKKCRSLGSHCGYTDCPFWGENYPRCYYFSKCPINDD